MNNQSSTVFFVGAGPGADDLITLRGAHLLESADVVVYAGSLVSPDQLARCKSDCQIHDSARLSLEEQVEIMYRNAILGKLVVRLHTGDPSMYGAIAEQIKKLNELGISSEIVPGVSSVFAAAAALKTELTSPGGSQSLVLTRTAGRTPMPSGETPTAFAKTGATLAFFLSMGKIESLMAELIAAGLDPQTPAAIAYRVSWPNELIIRGTIETLATQAKEAGIGRQALILVGRALAGNSDHSRLYDHKFSHGYRNQLPNESFVGRCALYAFTDKGVAKALEIASALPDAEIYTTRSITTQQPGVYSMSSAEWNTQFSRHWGTFDAHIFIGATGIAVRKIAPFLNAKTHDPAVVSCSENGHWVISLSSGHLGGANRLCRKIARITGGQAIISTATDSRNLTAFDEAAVIESAFIENPQLIKAVNSALLNGQAILFDGPKDYFDRYWSACPNVRRGTLPEKQVGEFAVVWSDSQHESITQQTDVLFICSRSIVLGVGCNRDTSIESLRCSAEDFLSRHNWAPRQLAGLATCTVKADESAIRQLADEWQLPLLFFTPEQLSTISVPHPSAIVKEKVGTPSVSEASAILATGQGKLLASKTRYNDATFAAALCRSRVQVSDISLTKDTPSPVGRLLVVSLGSGSPEHITPQATEAIDTSDIIAGYTHYVDMIRDRIGSKPVIQTGMLGEVSRCQAALEAAASGKTVCMVCSGDAGILAMAGLLYEMQNCNPQFALVDIVVIPGITAASLAASALGAPLQNGYCLISLSDLLIPGDEVRDNIEHAVHTHLPVVFYNPAGRKRRQIMEDAVNRFRQVRGDQTPAAIVRNAGRPTQRIWTGTLKDFPFEQVDMSSLILIGGKRTVLIDHLMYEARGYADKYRINPTPQE